MHTFTRPEQRRTAADIEGGGSDRPNVRGHSTATRTGGHDHEPKEGAADGRRCVAILRPHARLAAAIQRKGTDGVGGASGHSTAASPPTPDGPFLLSPGTERGRAGGGSDGEAGASDAGGRDSGRSGRARSARTHGAEKEEGERGLVWICAGDEKGACAEAGWWAGMGGDGHAAADAEAYAEKPHRVSGRTMCAHAAWPCGG